MPEQKILFGFVGHPSSGKDTAAEYMVEKYGFTHLSSGDFFRDYLTEHNLGAPTRENLSQIARDLRRDKGADIVMQLALKRSEQKLIVSGLRAVAEAQTLKNNGGKLVAFVVPVEIRYQRALQRGRIGENISFEEFQIADQKESRSSDPNGQNVDGVVEIADILIKNDTTKEEFFTKLDELVK
ncbi:MAG: nucleoside monophosphate kinase [Patescibacteria group bacterium]